MSDALSLLLAVRAYRPAAVFDHYDEGGSEIFDVAEVEIVEGGAAGQRLRVLVPTGSREAETWNRPGGHLRVRTGRSSLQPGATLFSGAFTVEGEP